ncbi:MAG: WGR domain-containing protein [Caulobacteraceae bacterium]
MTLLHRRDPMKNLARFYAISLEPSLFGGILLVRVWGRIGTRGRARTEAFSDESAASAAGERLVELKRHRGYLEVPSAV